MVEETSKVYIRAKGLTSGSNLIPHSKAVEGLEAPPAIMAEAALWSWTF